MCGSVLRASNVFLGSLISFLQITLCSESSFKFSPFLTKFGWGYCSLRARGNEPRLWSGDGSLCMQFLLTTLSYCVNSDMQFSVICTLHWMLGSIILPVVEVRLCPRPLGPVALVWSTWIVWLSNVIDSFWWSNLFTLLYEILGVHWLPLSMVPMGSCCNYTSYPYSWVLARKAFMTSCSWVMCLLWLNETIVMFQFSMVWLGVPMSWLLRYSFE